MDLETHVYLKDFQEDIASLIVKINSFMNFEFLVLNTHLALLYLSSIDGYII